MDVSSRDSYLVAHLCRRSHHLEPLRNDLPLVFLGRHYTSKILCRASLHARADAKVLLDDCDFDMECVRGIDLLRFNHLLLENQHTLVLVQFCRLYLEYFKHCFDVLRA